MAAEIFRKTIVVAEDTEAMGQVIREKLENAGYFVIWKVNGKDAWEAIQKETPALALLDWNMPIMDGSLVLAKMRNNAATKDIPVIMVTAKSKKAEVTVAAKNGVADYIVKPFAPAELLLRVKRALGEPAGV